MDAATTKSRMILRQYLTELGVETVPTPSKSRCTS
jgi:hypothetical protein